MGRAARRLWPPAAAAESCFQRGAAAATARFARQRAFGPRTRARLLDRREPHYSPRLFRASFLCTAPATRLSLMARAGANERAEAPAHHRHRGDRIAEECARARHARQRAAARV